MIEIGPGRGTLTEKLLEKAKKVIAVEKDTDLIDFLKEKFANYTKTGKLVILNQDILDYEPEFETYKLVGNIPYYITGEIFRKFLQNTDNQPQTISFVIQKEVELRILAKNKKESILSLSIKAYGDPKYKFTIKATNFNPKPKVDSALIVIENITKQKFDKYKIKENDFFEVLKNGFAHKRKLLIKNLKDYNISELEIDRKTRAEDLSLEQWLQIVKQIKK